MTKRVSFAATGMSRRPFWLFVYELFLSPSEDSRLSPAFSLSTRKQPVADA